MAFQTQPAMTLIAAVFVLAVAGIILVAVCSGDDPQFVVVTPDGTAAVGSPTPANGGQPPVTNTQVPVATATPEARLYVVQPGDTLFGICLDLLPNLDLDECIAAIITLNGLASADQIAVDQELILPGSGPLPTPAPTATPDPNAPTATPEPTASATPTPGPTATPQPQSLSGSGFTATDSITPLGAVTVLTLTHSGSGNFIVTAFTAGQPLTMVNVQGPYVGSRPLITGSTFTLTIQAEADWTIDISALGAGGSPSVTSTGDSVSALFDPPEDGAWRFLHTGSGNFIVWLRCADSDELVVNDIADVNTIEAVDFGTGPCFWEIQANNLWSINPA